MWGDSVLIRHQEKFPLQINSHKPKFHSLLSQLYDQKTTKGLLYRKFMLLKTPTLRFGSS